MALPKRLGGRRVSHPRLCHVDVRALQAARERIERAFALVADPAARGLLAEACDLVAAVAHGPLAVPGIAEEEAAAERGEAP